MRLTSSIVISFITLVLGLFFKQPLIWLPSSFFIASIIDSLTRKFVKSEGLGQWVKTSVILKFLCALLGFYAIIGQLVCIYLILTWFVF